MRGLPSGLGPQRFALRGQCWEPRPFLAAVTAGGCLWEKRDKKRRSTWGISSFPSKVVKEISINDSLVSPS